MSESEAYSNVPGSDLIDGLLTPRSMDSDGGDGPIAPADTAGVNKSKEKAFFFFCGSLPPQTLLARATDSLRRTFDDLLRSTGSLRWHVRSTRFDRTFDGLVSLSSSTEARPTEPDNCRDGWGPACAT